MTAYAPAVARRSQRTATLTELVDGARQGDSRAWDEIVRRFERLVWKIAGGFDVDQHGRSDICQTTWLRLAASIDQIREPEALPGWLARTARNAGLDIVRRSRSLVPNDALYDRADPTAAENDTSVLESELHRAVHLAFARLSPRCQRLLRLLTCVPPVTYDEITDIMQMPRGSIGPTRQRCISVLMGAPELRPFLLDEPV